jgi:hypothetical protein
MKKRAAPAPAPPAPKSLSRPHPLLRIADSLEIIAKAQAMRYDMTVEELREAEIVRPDVQAKPLVLNQTAQELDALSHVMPGSDEERDYLEQAMANGTLAAKLEALRVVRGGR